MNFEECQKVCLSPWPDISLLGICFFRSVLFFKNHILQCKFHLLISTLEKLHLCTRTVLLVIEDKLEPT